jgi:hypothetical protein
MKYPRSSLPVLILSVMQAVTRASLFVALAAACCAVPSPTWSQPAHFEERVADGER